MRAGTLGEFGDKRRAATGSTLFERVMETGSLVVRRLGGTRAGEMAIHRFLSAPSVTTQEMVETLAARTAAACAGRHIIAVQDTTEINFAGREERRRGLGPGGDGVSAGFFLHPVVAVERGSGDVLGLLGAKVWTRSDEYVETASRARPLAERESVRWLEGAACAEACLADAASVTVVADREGDIYAAFARRPPRIDLLVRAAQDRSLADGSRLFARPEAWPELARMTVTVPPSGPGRRGRLATVALRAGQVVISRPSQGSDPADPPQITLHMVEAREIGESGGEPPLLWRLLSSRPISNAAEAEEAVQVYKLRWRIEEIFRALKKDGMRLEETQMEKADALFKLAVVGLAAATRTLQLVNARDGSTRPATDVIDVDLMPAVEAIAVKLEGRTERQRNPHPRGSLAWLAWVVARLGGWNCYYKPPGPKTMHCGWAQLAAMAAGFLIASHQ